MKLINLIGLFVIVISSVASCSDTTETGSCEWLVEKYFMSLEFDDMADYVAQDEFDYITERPNIGLLLYPMIVKGELELTYRPIYQAEHKAVYAITFHSEDLITDMYCHLHDLEGKWKIQAIRELAMTGMIYGAIEYLEAMPEIPDSMMFGYNNMKLTVACDSALKVNFHQNEKIFNEIIDIFLKDSSIKKTQIDPVNPNVNNAVSENEKKIIDLQTQIYIQSVRRNKDDTALLVGGILENALYYIYVPEGKPEPLFDINENIYIEKLSKNWFLVKQT